MYRRKVNMRFAKKKNNTETEKIKEPKLILDIIEEEYPEKASFLKEKLSQVGKLFTNDEWISILTKSRATFKKPGRNKKRR